MQGGGRRRWMDILDGIAAAALHPLALVAMGGAIGSVLRYVLGRAIDGHTWQGGMPWGTLTINLVGSFLLGFFVISFIESVGSGRRELYLILGTGLCGGFTTFSTFEWETYRLLREGNWPTALGYVLASVVLGLVALFAGVLLANQFFGHRE